MIDGIQPVRKQVRIQAARGQFLISATVRVTN